MWSTSNFHSIPLSHLALILCTHSSKRTWPYCMTLATTALGLAVPGQERSLSKVLDTTIPGSRSCSRSWEPQGTMVCIHCWTITKMLTPHRFVGLDFLRGQLRILMTSGCTRDSSED